MKTKWKNQQATNHLDMCKIRINTQIPQVLHTFGLSNCHVNPFPILLFSRRCLTVDCLWACFISCYKEWLANMKCAAESPNDLLNEMVRPPQD